MLDDINELRTFVTIVTTRSLSAAARQMDLALSVVSKRLATLERRTGTRLIARSTRHLAPTEEGMELYERAQRILAEVDEAEAALTSGQVEPQGLLRVSAPVAFVLTDRMVDLIEEGIDVVIRIGPPKDSQLVMRKLIDDYRVVVGAPEYLQQRGTPATPAELEAHDCVHYRGVGAHWRLVNLAGEAIEMQAESRLRSNSGEAALDWALAGCGLVMYSWLDVIRHCCSGRVVRFYQNGAANQRPSARYPSNRHLPNRMRFFSAPWRIWLLDTLANLRRRRRPYPREPAWGQNRQWCQRPSRAGLPSTAEEPLPCPSRPEMAETQNRKQEAANRRRTETALHRVDEP